MNSLDNTSKEHRDSLSSENESYEPFETTENPPLLGSRTPLASQRRRGRCGIPAHWPWILSTFVFILISFCLLIINWTSSNSAHGTYESGFRTDLGKLVANVTALRVQPSMKMAIVCPNLTLMHSQMPLSLPSGFKRSGLQADYTTMRMGRWFATYCLTAGRNGLVHRTRRPIDYGMISRKVRSFASFEYVVATWVLRLTW